VADRAPSTVHPRVLFPQKPDHFEVTAEVPGFKKEEVNVEVSHGVLKITAEHNEERKDEGEKDGWKYHRMERSSGSLHRSIKLPASADVDRVTASADNGVLTINIAKKPEAMAATPKKVPVA
jgi:HSP20 family protein